MNVKAQGLLNAAKYIEDTYGRDALGDVLRACSAAVRDTYTSSIAINWHPQRELCELVDTAESRLGGRGRLAEEVGAAGARANMKGMLLRLAFYWGKPEYLMTRIAGMWRQFNDEGDMTLLEMNDRIARVEVRGVKEPHGTACRILTGWVSEITTALGATHVNAQHALCRARGDARCLWEVRGVFGAGGPSGRDKAAK